MPNVYRTLTLANSEHFCSTYRTDTLSSWLAVLHFDRLWIIHLSLLAAFHTISLH